MVAVAHALKFLLEFHPLASSLGPPLFQQGANRVVIQGPCGQRMGAGHFDPPWLPHPSNGMTPGPEGRHAAKQAGLSRIR
jgi:hypothetical protein